MLDSLSPFCCKKNFSPFKYKEKYLKTILIYIIFIKKMLLLLLKTFHLNGHAHTILLLNSKVKNCLLQQSKQEITAFIGVSSHLRNFYFTDSRLHFNYVIRFAGLQITNGQAPVTLSGQTCFCSDITCFWPVKF